MLTQVPTLYPLPPATEVPTSFTDLFSGVQEGSLETRLLKVIFGNLASLPESWQALPFFKIDGMSGYHYSHHHKIIATLRFGVTASGYFVIQTIRLDLPETWISYYFHPDGSFSSREGVLTQRLAAFPDLFMEAHCPILNHLYTILASEYQNPGKGTLSTEGIHTLEKILKKVRKTKGTELSLSRPFQDHAIISLNDKMMKIDFDPVYTWKERYGLIKNLKELRSKVIRTKSRAHRLSLWSYTFPLFIYDFYAACSRFYRRPFNNFLGVLERLFIDPLRWFGKVVKNNMGYSIALAIYSPFTFFFITQPMNPHATWAVGKVRSAYIEFVNHLSSITETKTDSKQTLHFASTASAENTHALSPTQKNPPSFENKPGQFGILLSSEIPDVNEQSWDERMSNFKAMQINYESNLEVAPRIGRLEQMETQLNWPLIMESTWIETERYLELLHSLSAHSEDYHAHYIELVQEEITRTQTIRLYLWDRNIRFILDHPFTMMDQGHEQTETDYYVGRAFILLRHMTETLAHEHPTLSLPAGYTQITTLAQKFEADYHANGSVLDRLKNNSKLFAQADPKNTLELRAYMKRQWEILYLLQNHAQEGANMALQMYVWSVRNTAWLLQSFLSAKREEMELLSKHLKKKSPSSGSLSLNPVFKRIDSQYEALFHMMVLEYASIRKEIGGALKNDIESTQRKKIIDDLENFLKKRDLLLKTANLL